MRCITVGMFVADKVTGEQASEVIKPLPVTYGGNQGCVSTIFSWHSKRLRKNLMMRTETISSTVTKSFESGKITDPHEQPGASDQEFNNSDGTVLVVHTETVLLDTYRFAKAA